MPSFEIAQALLKFESLEKSEDTDFPYHKFPTESPEVISGLRRQWALGIIMKRYLRDALPELSVRRSFERDIREECAILRETVELLMRPENATTEENKRAFADLIGKRVEHLTIIHNLSVTADGAELNAQAF